MPAPYPRFEAPYAPDETHLVEQILADMTADEALQQRIAKRATKFVEGIRTQPKNGGLEEFMQEYSLSTKEGLALMVLAEALLRVPDAQTQNRLIEEKLGQGDWDTEYEADESWLLMAASWGIGLSANVLKPGDTPGAVLKAMIKRLGLPVIRTGTRQAMQYLGQHFVLGQTIEEAMRRARKKREEGFRFSFDMLGEGARTAADAARYYQAYQEALEAIGEDANKRSTDLPDRPGLSVKLSAIHPRYEAQNCEQVMAELVPQIIALAQKAKYYQLNLTIDAEEADRLELSLEVFQAVASDPSLANWDGFGLAVQAYQKRGPAVIDWVHGLAQHLDRRFMVRLVKGAYWDTEIKRAQERGLPGFPVFTKKAATDLCYLQCARKLLAARPRLFPQFATHNALSLAAILEMAGTDGGFEFQRLHGMGEALYELEMTIEGIPARIYAPVGGYKDLLAYLVRRLLENSANSSFVAQVADEDVSMAELLKPPQEILRQHKARTGSFANTHILLPAHLFSDRENSRGAEIGYRPDLQSLAAACNIKPICTPAKGQSSLTIHNPATGEELAKVGIAEPELVAAAIDHAKSAFRAWNAMAVEDRAAIVVTFSKLLEENRDPLLSLLCAEAGKTHDDALAEIREAVDFCRYYANEAQRLFTSSGPLPGPVGEDNSHHYAGRGVFACISPWNFPLAIFLGQIIAALVTGNTVVAKPAEQTPLIADFTIKLLYQAGLPENVCKLIFGAGATGAALTGANDIAGVVFTGSTQTARRINQTLAAKQGPIVPLIAETGGINAMIVDSTALPEQVADDVVNSAFKSAGQRCSALRILYVQEDVADTMVEMIIGAAKELRAGDPANIQTDIGPVIDEEARAGLMQHIAQMRDQAQLLYQGNEPDLAGTFVAPHIFQLSDPSQLTTEAFGPILHIVRWQEGQLDQVIEHINATGYGLTFGLHSRLETVADYVAPKIHAGNIYINRNMIGAVVGVQPFGGAGLSGTGPKAGGPLYLTRFVEEKTISTNTAAAGGNASLIAMSD
ncbi:MAG: bifunctional proline dehydrogenase/L-glutamate gamma-semialdehyde dehydrogenase PutA [bacterium]